MPPPIARALGFLDHARLGPAPPRLSCLDAPHAIQLAPPPRLKASGSAPRSTAAASISIGRFQTACKFSKSTVRPPQQRERRLKHAAADAKRPPQSDAELAENLPGWRVPHGQDIQQQALIVAAARFSAAPGAYPGGWPRVCEMVQHHSLRARRCTRPVSVAAAHTLPAHRLSAARPAAAFRYPQATIACASYGARAVGQPVEITLGCRPAAGGKPPRLVAAILVRIEAAIQFHNPHLHTLFEQKPDRALGGTRPARRDRSSRRCDRSAAHGSAPAATVSEVPQLATTSATPAAVTPIASM